MSITVAKTAGFCFGVRRAVETAFALSDSGASAYTFGELIHNPRIVADLVSRGIPPIGKAEENIDKRTVIIRSHGVSRRVYDELNALGCKIIDATCPFVAKIHNIVSELSADTPVLIAGDAAHPEVEGIAGFCRGFYAVVKDVGELTRQLDLMDNKSKNSIVLVAQTTFSTDEWEKCAEKLKKVCTNPGIFDTICNATEKRQLEAKSLAARSDAMIVVGGRHSSNTAKLAQICREYCDTFLIEEALELLELDLRHYSRIGVTAGASTPACIIKEVHNTMSDIIKDQDELSFEEMLNESFKTTGNGEKVTAIVTGIAPNEISVDIGTKHAGYVPLSELTDDPNATPEELVKIGDSMELLVVRVNDVEGTVMLSKKRLDAAAGFERVMNAVDTNEILEGKIVEVIKGGVLALTSGVKVFIPASQATVNRTDSLEELLHKKVEFKILEVNRQRKRAVGSIRAVLRDQRKVLEDKFWETVEVGKRYKGLVKSLTSYGAFVNLGGVDGMVHISELSWSRIKHPSEVVKVGDEVEVYIKEIDAENKKISLGFKNNEENPWQILQDKYAVDSVCTVKIVSMTPFGAFAQIVPGVDGLIHISQISNERVLKPSDVLEIGQEVEAKITEIDVDKKRVSLSMRALLEKPEEGAEEPAVATAATMCEAGPDGVTGVPDAE